MDCPITLPVYCNGQEISTLNVEKAGLYYRFTCRCSLPKGEILRIYGIDGLQIVPIGILMPHGDEFELHEQISVRSWSLPELRIAVAGFSPEEGVLPWRGEIDGVPIPSGWLRRTEDGAELLISQDEVFPLPADLDLTEPVECGGIACLRLQLDETGMPIHPAAEPEWVEPEWTEPEPAEPEWAAAEETPEEDAT